MAVSDTPTPPNEHSTVAQDELEVRSLRSQNRLIDAIDACEAAARRHPGSLLFPKVACDMYLAIGKPQAASGWMLEMLLRMWMAGETLFNDFAKRFQKVVSALDHDSRTIVLAQLNEMLAEGKVHRRFIRRCEELLRIWQTHKDTETPIPAPNPHSEEELEKISQTIRHDAPLPELNLGNLSHSNWQNIKTARKLEEQAPSKLENFIEHADLSELHQGRHKQLFDYLIAFLERRDRFLEALRLLSSHPSIRQPSPLQASYLRVCRKLRRFDLIQKLLSDHPGVLRTEVFNVLYELVYYFEAQSDLQRARNILGRIERLFTSQQPILQTLRNFYIRFGMFPDASRIDLHLAQLREGGKYREEVSESQAEVYSNLEHQRQLAALSDLTNGISHELGQPITNIRYTIQLFRRKLQKEMSPEIVFRVFDTVLSETERMGGLVKRLAPITASRRMIEQFDAVVRTRERIEVERARLSDRNTRVIINGHPHVRMHADPVRFDQLISNLLLNALDAITDLPAGVSGKITIHFAKFGDSLKMIFEDNGPGISPEHRLKIFEPFFSTKPPGKGEGLGLFIVWNLLKMQGGSISVDSRHDRGARFIVYLPSETRKLTAQLEP